MTTFQQLGIPFPLYEAPINESSEYQPDSSCSICKRHEQPCFNLSIGCALMVTCGRCKTVNGLDAHSRNDVECCVCGSPVLFPSELKENEIKTCYDCLRNGGAAMTKDTELGMVSWDQALQERTHGRPGLTSNEFETIVVSQDENWVGVKLPAPVLFELLRTPSFTTWQGEEWLFCCKTPMTYIGEWRHVAKSFSSTEEARELFDSIMAECPDSTPREDIWDTVSTESEAICVYVFRCKSCGSNRATWDMD